MYDPRAEKQEKKIEKRESDTKRGGATYHGLGALPTVFTADVRGLGDYCFRNQVPFCREGVSWQFDIWEKKKLDRETVEKKAMLVKIYPRLQTQQKYGNTEKPSNAYKTSRIPQS